LREFRAGVSTGAKAPAVIQRDNLRGNSVKKGLIMSDLVTYILLKGILYGGVFLLLAGLIDYIV
jgi:hypothetical protein